MFEDQLVSRCLTCVTISETLPVVEAARKNEERHFDMKEMMIQCADTAAVRMVAAMFEENKKERSLVGK